MVVIGEYRQSPEAPSKIWRCLVHVPCLFVQFLSSSFDFDREHLFVLDRGAINDVDLPSPHEWMNPNVYRVVCWNISVV